jgi:hypothetical protein
MILSDIRSQNNQINIIILVKEILYDLKKKNVNRIMLIKIFI